MKSLTGRAVSSLAADRMSGFPASVLMLLTVLLLFMAFWKVRGILRRRRRMLALAAAGKRGEDDTAAVLADLRGCRFLLRNLYIPKAAGGTTEIDLIMLHKKGIFVVENKNYTGFIYGDDREEHWLQIKPVGSGVCRKSFFSPVRQNEIHIRHVSRLLQEAGFGNIPVYSLVIFNDRARLKKVRVRTAGLMVTELKQVKRAVRRKTWWRLRALSRTGARRLYEYLKPLENPGRKVRRQHVKQGEKTY